MKPRVKHQVMPEAIRSDYKHAAAYVWNYVGGDCPEAESYSTRAIVEIIRDANRISGAARTGCYVSAEFKEWIKEHEYDPEFSQDMDRAVREVI